MKYYILLSLAVLFWSGNSVFARMISTQIDPLELSFYRWFFVLLLLSPYILINHKRILNSFKKNPILLIVLGTLGIAFFNTFLYFGLQTTTAINALLVNSSIPIIIIILSKLILKATINKIQLFGIVLSTLGVLYLIAKGSWELLKTLEFTNGDLWILLACFTWALYSIFLKFKPKDLNAFDFFSISTSIGVIILYVLFKYFGYSISFNFIENKEILYSLSYMAIFASILSFYFWNISTVEVGANKAGQFSHLMPIFGAILAYIFLKEKLEFYHFIGMFLIALGIYLSIFYKKRIKK